MSSTLPILPLELIIEILSRLPVKILIRFTSVSKQWKSLIFDPTFARLHLQRSPKHTHALLTICDDVNDIDSWILTPYSVRHLIEHPSSIINEDECIHSDETYNVLDSINGLVCLFDVKSQKNRNSEIWVRFWNPSLRLSSKKSPILTVMPNVVGLLYAKVHYGFGYDDSSDTYKVVALFWDHTTQKLEGRVHCMGDSCWRKTLTCPAFPILLLSITGLFVNGSVNWLALNLNCHQYKWKNVTVKQLVIFTLDLRNETCKNILLPNGLCEVPEEEPRLAVLRGCLCFYYYNHMGTHFVLWEMREFGVQESWTQLVNVGYTHLQFDYFAPDLLLPICLSENGDVLLLGNLEQCDVIMYNLRDESVEYIQLPNNQIWFAHEHMQSLVLPCPHSH